MNAPTTLPNSGDKFVVAKLETTNGFSIAEKFIIPRKLGPVIYKGHFPGHGGDVWACEHEDGSVAAYCFTELEVAQ